ncbi:MAG TPA: hypothetical protein VFG04_06210 [Planctomycetaceae bacterium]|nr:hypothetical protein [Planctomycetaceae bacterium]
MYLPVWCRNIRLAERLACLFAIAFVSQGCGPPTAEQALEQAFKANPSAQRVEVVKFEGTVAVDGLPPNKPGTKFFIILNDPKNPQDPKTQPKLIGGCDNEGNFFFSTNGARDGVQTGSYVVTFVQLHHPQGLFNRHGSSVFNQPDELKNLYSDPEKNAANPEFNVEIKSPGRTDWHFDLAVAGKDAKITPGPHAITKLDYR